MKKRLLASLAAFAFATLVRGQEPVFGPEFQVGTSTTNDQREAGVANIGAAGNVLVTWTESRVMPFTENIIGRLFDVTGAPIGGDIPITAFADFDPIAIRPSAQSDAAGNFVVVWTTLSGGMGEVRARRYDAAGTPQGGEIAVNTYTTDSQYLSAVAMNSSGEFVVVWMSHVSTGSPDPGQDGSGSGVFGQLFDNSGAPAGSEFQVNQVTTDDQWLPRVAMGPGGDFIVVWSDEHAETVKARRYDANALPLGGEFQVPTGLDFPIRPDVALDSTGKAIVVWASLQDGSGDGIFGQRLDASGNKLGPEFNVNSITTGDQVFPRVTTGPEGDFTVIWESFAEDGEGEGLFAQHYDATGRREFRELPINALTAGYQFPAIAAQPNGQFVAAWTNRASGKIKARVAGFPDVEPMIVDALHPTARTAPSVSNFNGVLESGESVLVEPAFRNPSTAPLALTGTASNIRGLPGPTYTLVNTSASYGTIAAGATNGCLEATADCYQVSVSGERPAPHWDALFDETLSYEAFTRTAALHVGGSFPDVPQNGFYPFIENMFHNGITGGCGGGNYCPVGDVTRAQMAVFLLKSRWGAGFIPPPATGTAFSDVAASNPFAPWIEELVRENITAGCGGGMYCPNNPVTRQQMAVFLLKTLLGSTYDPPVCAGDFDDVPCTPNEGFSDWVEDLNGRGITAGCQLTPPLYCPLANILRQQMAVFLVKTFGLQLYGD